MQEDRIPCKMNPCVYASGHPPSLAHPAAQDSIASYFLMGEPSLIYMIANQRERCKREQPEYPVLVAGAAWILLESLGNRVLGLWRTPCQKPALPAALPPCSWSRSEHALPKTTLQEATAL